jgi:hypothetical protein
MSSKLTIFDVRPASGRPLPSLASRKRINLAGIAKKRQISDEVRRDPGNVG